LFWQLVLRNQSTCFSGGNMNVIEIDCLFKNFQVRFDLKHNSLFLNLQSFNEHTLENLIKLQGWLRNNQKELTEHRSFIVNLKADYINGSTFILLSERFFMLDDNVNKSNRITVNWL
jgi:hypothetical protein